MRSHYFSRVIIRFFQNVQAEDKDYEEEFKDESRRALK
jgi:hypothetical protein